MSDQSFPKSLRLRSRRDFDRVFQRRTSVADGLAILYGCENDLPITRIGLSVSRKVGGAVVRNRWKRLFREAFRTTRAEWPAGMDVVLIPRRGANPDFHALVASLPRLAKRVNAQLKKRKRTTLDSPPGTSRG